MHQKDFRNFPHLLPRPLSPMATMQHWSLEMFPIKQWCAQLPLPVHGPSSKLSSGQTWGALKLLPWLLKFHHRTGFWGVCFVFTYNTMFYLLMIQKPRITCFCNFSLNFKNSQKQSCLSIFRFLCIQGSKGHIKIDLLFKCLDKNFHLSLCI